MTEPERWTVDDDNWFVFDGRRVAVALCYLEPEPETLPVEARAALKADVRAARAHDTCHHTHDTLRQARTDIERFAEAVHQAYLDTCERLGWPVKPANQVPYAELPEDSKELDRASVRAVLDLLAAEGPDQTDGGTDG